MKRAVVWALASLVAVSAFAGNDKDDKEKKDNFNPNAFEHANDNGIMNSNPNSALHQTSMVPEADTIAMLVAGVAVVGVVVASRRKK